MSLIGFVVRTVVIIGRSSFSSDFQDSNPTVVTIGPSLSRGPGVGVEIGRPRKSGTRLVAGVAELKSNRRGCCRAKVEA